MSIIGMSEQWVTARVKQKGDSKCIAWKNLRNLVLAHPDTRKKSRRLCLEYLRVGYLLQSTRADR
ncbi:hypothetical protein Gotur_032157 [Gossypium turneri]